MTQMQSFKDKVALMLVLNKGERISQFEHHGKRYWLKQVEQLTGAMRFLKADSAKALIKETQVLKQLDAEGAPVPKVVANGEGYLVIEDAGRTVRDWLDNNDIAATEQQNILNDSSQALADLHQMQLAHGRPALRDISWRSGEVKFIDFEANQQKGSVVEQQIRDLLVYIHSLYRYLGADSERISKTITAYRQAGGEAIWQKSKDFLASWQWLYYFASPIKNVGGKDLKPVYWVLWHFRNN
ncbi:phosphotransferase [Shewanella sp. 10N.7]|uniref:phosphotransferase n=1 Tax=Shewanella sp. 10N.7 TaxID=2885093 RepID=UPI001E529D23|nr:phosphotransferase [Shewanella sp. 10N.7]MCC4832404.1 phosphotransferase [Shewanella sp. 10N.7]